MTSNSSDSLVVAAVDLGSNSFHMLVAQGGETGLQVIDRIKEPVRLAQGLAPDKSLLPEVEERALECLSRFGQRLQNIPPEQLRIVGTNTLRRLRKSRRFIAAAEERLGHRIEVISGVEEARLIYGGVSHGLPMDGSRRLVVDIGGGSTELILGVDSQPEQMESVHMGCVSWTQRYFADGKITAAAMRKARLAAGAELKFMARRYRNIGWAEAIGASGSTRAVQRVAAAMQINEHQVTPEAIEQIGEAMIKAGQIDKLELPGLKEDRQPVFVGSYCVLAGVFDSLKIDAMQISDRALREGVVYDLLGRLTEHDVRDRSAQELVERFKLDIDQARRVEGLALNLFEQVHQSWKIDPREGRDMLRWAAFLHEIGMGISHAGYHKHGAYILEQMDLHGFSRTDQQIIGALVRSHRGKWSGDRFEELPKPWKKWAMRLSVLLRVAVIMNRGRNPEMPPCPQAKAEKNSLQLMLPPGWLDEHALTRTDLEQDIQKLAATGFNLSVE